MCIYILEIYICMYSMLNLNKTLSKVEYRQTEVDKNIYFFKETKKAAIHLADQNLESMALIFSKK